MKERFLLAKTRIYEIAEGKDMSADMPEAFADYFRKVAEFLKLVLEHENFVEEGGLQKAELSELQRRNHSLYEDILPAHYEESYGNPAYCVKRLGEEYGRLLSFLYAEMRSLIPFCHERQEEEILIRLELFSQVYSAFEGSLLEEEKLPSYESVREDIYYFVSDYTRDSFRKKLEGMFLPEQDFAWKILRENSLDTPAYLYAFGEYITENELGTARRLRSLPEETIQKMADVYTEGYRIGFINTGKDLSKKSVVNIRYSLGFERVIRAAIANFRAMGLKPVIYRAASGVITKREHHKIGYFGAVANWQYEYDHRQDQALFMDKRYIERRLEVMHTVYEQNKEQAAQFAGPAVMETFGEKPFSPKAVPEAPAYCEEQRELALQYDSRSGQITNEYIKGEERSFTIIAYPVPEIGPKYEEIFDEVIRINTLDAKLYEKVQQTMIDALDQGEKVRVIGKGENRTDMEIRLWSLKDARKETIFENCVADVNIPVGEVFTSPVLEGTNGVLHVSRVYLDGLQYKDLELKFKDGKIVDYRCGNFKDEEEGRRYIFDNVLKNHDTLPLGEFAIGTNTTAYAAGKKYGIEDKMPILIAEKTGPHFAVGDTCYSWSEDVRVYNPNGKEIVAKDNSCSLKRKEDPSAAYFQCHTDITVPYEELEEISVVTKDGKHIILIKDGRFVLPGTEILNEPLKQLEN